MTGEYGKIGSPHQDMSLPLFARDQIWRRVEARLRPQGSGVARETRGDSTANAASCRAAKYALGYPHALRQAIIVTVGRIAFAFTSR